VADGQLPIQTKAGPGEEESPPLTPEQFENSDEFRTFRQAMKKLLKVRKSELDARVEHAKRTSPRRSNTSPPGRKPTR